MGTDIRTFCRICEPSCGLIATVDEGRLVAISPDRSHPVTKGFACHKGLAALDLHNDPDRLSYPLQRRADGTWSRMSWDAAATDIAARLQRIRAEHGAMSIASYVGNPMAFNALGQLHIGQFLTALRPGRMFSSGTQDCANKFVASEAIFGSRNVHPIPDLAHTDLCLIIGENPRASQASFFSVANVVGELRTATARGARIVFLNPRRIETPDRGVGDTLLIKPDTDLYFLASLLHEIDRQGGFDARTIERHGTRVAELRAFIGGYPAALTAPVTGIGAAAVEELASAWVAASAPSVHASTGLNMGRQGTLAYWLVHMLAFVTGRLGVEGGNLKSDGFYPNTRSGIGVPEAGYHETEWGTLRRGALPGTLMSHAILDAEQPIRALVVFAGNPLLSIGGEERLRKAFEQLELLVVVDIYRNATAELADYVLPSTDEFEREDLNVVNIGTSYRPFAQYTPAVVEPAAERKPDWWIAHRLMQALGVPSLLDNPNPDPWSKYRHMLASGSNVDLGEMQRTGDVAVLPEPLPGQFFDDHVTTADGRIDCCPPTFSDALARATVLFDEMAADTDGLKLISRRDQWMHNSWFANLPRMKRGGRDSNPLWMHPDDASARGLLEGSMVRISNAYGEIESAVRFADDLMPGVVSMLHGWGHRSSPGMTDAAARPGVNVNALLPIGEGSFEPLSSQAHMTGIRVEVTAAASL